MAAPGSRRVVLGALVVGAALVVVVWLLATALDPRGSGASGNGFTYRGQFYGVSDAQVRPERLGEVLDREVAYQDTHVDVRAVTGVVADVAVAASVGGTDTDPAWVLVSPEADLAADPWADARLAPALRPRP